MISCNIHESFGYFCFKESSIRWYGQC
uniref:Uncharacterized protein n=1 Tax=Rhizophora mucronata TaxID=61149 RepID=A0A2P2NVG4_RHIMU